MALAGQLRLDKYLADMSVGTRREARLLIQSGRVKLNDIICKGSESRVNPELDRVCVDDAPVIYIGKEYFMMNKPAGVLSATRDWKDKTVLELIQDCKCKDLFPVGRLDKDTEGFLLITNDGMLAHQLLSPRKHVDKIYYARLQGKVTNADREAFLQGVDIGEEKLTMPAKLHIIKAGNISEVEVTLQEGKFHQVKRMFQAVGKEVIYLKRLSMGGLMLDEHLKPGEYRKLTLQELELIKKGRMTEESGIFCDMGINEKH